METQFRAVLSKIKKMLEKEGGNLNSIVRKIIFIDDYASKKVYEKILKYYYNDNLPPISFVVMPPFKGKFAVEAWANIPKGKEFIKISYSREISGKLAFIEEKNRKYLYLLGIWSNGKKIREEALSIYERINRILKKSGFEFGDVFRFWLYLKNINGKERYAKLNQARTEYFENLDFNRKWKVKNRKAYPSSTGIGIKDPNILMELIALKGDVEFIPIENPFQIRTDKYSKEQSIGIYTPKFCRAIILKTDDFIKILVSGTASIIGGETKHPNDINAQTKETINNIKKLISKENLNRYGLSKNVELKDFLQLRVYVKKRNHFEDVISICEKNFPNIPILYLNADICRENLLVEMEGLAIV